ncbi:MAG: glutamine--fructose-6-phosphate transaminase (isomerizing) [Pseudomonadales bacterium]|nr:glutamine--fructose-6-phosphate transaminase (isomerizing) [Pseudomonadales bacterium]
MCGIVGAVASRDVAEILVEGLNRLEYRGYDSAGLAVIDAQQQIGRIRKAGKVKNLSDQQIETGMNGHSGVAHTRWATHGEPTEKNAHPHMSGNKIALVHNGIIENHESLRTELLADGYEFGSQTDTEVIVHQIEKELKTASSFSEAVQTTVDKLEGAFAFAVLHSDFPDLLLGARKGSPFVIGVGIGENFLASDPLAIRQVTDRFIYLENGDFVELTKNSIKISDRDGIVVERSVEQLEHSVESVDKGIYRHYMMKEIYEQPKVIFNTFEDKLENGLIREQIFTPAIMQTLAKVEAVQIIACGTSYHAGLVAKYWIEEIAGLPCAIEVASEFRYRNIVVSPNTLFVTISQSGETADTLAALYKAKHSGYLSSMVVCNVPASSLVRETDFCLMTQAGPEIGVASTKAFTTQLVALFIFTLLLAKQKNLSIDLERELVRELQRLPSLVDAALDLDDQIKKTSEHFADKHHALFLGRGTMYPVAMEGSLKLKEISYIHAEAYPAGELKHGPLALVDSDMPVITVAPNNELLEKLKSNLEEVRARGGELYVFADKSAKVFDEGDCHVIAIPEVHDLLAPILYTIPLQLLSYHVAVLKGTDIDQPRNLAKSVTVE